MGAVPGGPPGGWGISGGTGYEMEDSFMAGPNDADPKSQGDEVPTADTVGGEPMAQELHKGAKENPLKKPLKNI